MTHSRFALPVILAVLVSVARADEFAFHVDVTRGNDAWTGKLSAPNAGRTDGPFASLARARDAVRSWRKAGLQSGPVRVAIHPGRYELAEPLVFAPEDSGTTESPTVFEALSGEAPAVASGGTIVKGWKNGPRGEWVAELPGLKQGWLFRHVAVDGRWRGRSHLPATDTFVMAGLAGADLNAKYDTPADRFEYATGQIDPNWKDIKDVEIVALHFWVDSHFKIKSVDPTRRIVTLDRFSKRKFSDDYRKSPARYYVENVYEALEPGQFYADSKAGTIHYRPDDGEAPSMNELVAPRLTTLVEFRGDPSKGRFVEHITLKGLTLSDSTWEPDPHDAVDGQAASETPGALVATGARNVVIEGCRLVNLGGYGIDLREGCRGVRIVGNELAFLGAGGILVNGGDARAPEMRRTGDVTITDNRLHNLGRLFHSGVGVLIRNAFGTKFVHNEVSELYYTAVSVGWVWGYAPSVSRDNVIEFNHLHHIGHGLLSDMGAVYTLGVSPGTIVRNNLIHDVEAHGYGGWGLYTDEGSSGIVLENNLVYRTTHGGFHQHYGRDNIVRNNIFALARDEQIARSRDEPHRSFTFERNIVYYRTGSLFGHNWSGASDHITLDHNVYWNASGQAPEFPGGLEAWHARGFDQHSVIADPKFMDPDHDDFRLQPDSPARRLGFRPLDLSAVGPRTPPPGRRVGVTP